MEEMLGQVLYANIYIKKRFAKKEDGTWWKLRNIVFMGMGEPLLNYENLKLLFPYLLEQQKLSLSRRHITISTVGIIPGIEKLISDNIDVKLAVSLHAPNQKLREKLIPFAKFYPLDQLLEVLDRYVKATNNRIFYEYIMIKGETDSLELAHETGKLLQKKLVHLNLIPYNENPVMDFEESSTKQIWAFKGIVESYGVTVTIRDSMGREVKSACGQLGHEALQKKR
ncbi:MAG: radical SAM protein [bacterium]|nr:radical SAM protein [bacterium]